MYVMNVAFGVAFWWLSEHNILEPADNGVACVRVGT